MKDTRLNEDKRKALENALTQIEKQFGKGSIMRLGDDKGVAPVEVISTGALSLDLALGIGGIPRGRITEVFGQEASGKTSLALSIVAEAQKKGGTAAYIDAEHALDPNYAKIIGVNIDDLYVAQPDTGEQALEITESLVRSGAIDVIVIDSVAALVPKVELEGEMGEVHLGLQARLMSQALRKLTAAISKSRTAVIFINQVREKIGVFFGSPETTPGGRALKFYASIRLELRRLHSIQQKDEVIGTRIRIKVVKNKVAPPFKEAEINIYHDRGICYESSVFEAALERGLIKQSGSWYIYNETKLGQGKEKAIEYLYQNPQITQQLSQILLKDKVGVAIN
jgi:recombination protein RecA